MELGATWRAFFYPWANSNKYKELKNQKIKQQGPTPGKFDPDYLKKKYIVFVMGP